MLNLHGINLSAAQTEAVSQMMADAAKEPKYRYPWDGLEEEMEANCLPEMAVVGYGSLINSGSAGRTLSQKAMETSRAVIAFGARRLFNYEIPGDVDRYAPATHPLARAALNARPTGKIDDIVNGIVMKLSVTEIPAMRGREVGYDLVPVACLEWNDLERPPFLAYILCCFDEPGESSGHTNDEIEPHRGYYSVCRAGVSEFGEGFLRLWLATTYLADGVTPVAEWEVNVFPEVT
ncbi:MAG: hypothetical protein ACYSTF_05925 [Planctomycetota bacterium]|jgi:hypothetical protein